MIVQRSTHVKLKKDYRKILFLFPAFEETFVFLGSNGVKRDCLVHVDKYGYQKFCHYFQKPMDSLAMINDFEVILLETRADTITIVDLKNKYLFKRIPHYFMNHQSDQCYLWTFPDTKYMAVVEHGRVNDNRLKITYFNYPQKNPIQQEGKLLIHHRNQVLQKQFQANNGQWTFQYQLVKANNHSMIIWYKDRHDQAFEFRFYRQDKDYRPLYRNDPYAQNGWEYKSVAISHKLGEFYNMNKLYIALLEVFELQKDKLFVCCQSNRDRPKNQGQLLTNTYVVDLLTSTVQQTPHNLGKYHMYQIDRKLIGSCHMIRTFYFKNSEIQESPVIYYSNTTFEPIFEQKWKCSYKTKYIFPGYDSFTMIENEYENANVSEFTCSYKKLIEYKEIMMFFMMEINEDFDDDLMQDAIGLICD